MVDSTFIAIVPDICLIASNQRNNTFLKESACDVSELLRECLVVSLEASLSSSYESAEALLLSMVET